MLYIYSAILTLLLVLVSAGAVLAANKDMAEVLAKPLHKTLVAYDPKSTSPDVVAIVAAWDAVQNDVKLSLFTSVLPSKQLKNTIFKKLTL
jgi:hypothetical protein